MPLYDRNNMDRMRMDAVRRSQEMHRRSEENAPRQYVQPLKQSDGTDIADTLKKLTSDTDVLLIAAMLLLLYKEGADIKLLLALAYILL